MWIEYDGDSLGVNIENRNIKYKNKYLGKPSNYLEAKIMLNKLSNSSHDVITAVCFLTKEKIEIIPNPIQIEKAKKLPT